eukprot:1383492-Amorphochlora_amoeboformis.AAC.1
MKLDNARRELLVPPYPSRTSLQILFPLPFSLSLPLTHFTFKSTSPLPISLSLLSLSSLSLVSLPFFVNYRYHHTHENFGLTFTPPALSLSSSPFLRTEIRREREEDREDCEGGKEDKEK